MKREQTALLPRPEGSRHRRIVGLAMPYFLRQIVICLKKVFPFLWSVKWKIILRWIHQSYSEISLEITAADHCACWSLYCAGEQLKS